MIRRGEHTVWREHAYDGGRARFEAARGILSDRFAGRFGGLKPSQRSLEDLDG